MPNIAKKKTQIALHAHATANNSPKQSRSRDSVSLNLSDESWLFDSFPPNFKISFTPRPLTSKESNTVRLFLKNFLIV